MLDTSPIVQSAISSFNNAALFGPSFFWTAVLMLPLFWLVWKFRDQISCDWRKHLPFGIGAVLLGWLVLNPGNYMALRNAETFLPLCIAGITFFLTAFVVGKLPGLMPMLYAKIGNRKYKKLIVWGGVILMSAVLGVLSGIPTVFGILLQSAAIFCGVLVGRAGFLTPGLSWIIFALTTMILMQPEFFRFGQMGSLTLVHKFFILAIGAMFAALVALRNIRAREKIHHSAFVKLKWAARIVSALCVILFLLTESVPVFLGTIVVLFFQFALSIWHARAVPSKLDNRIWATILCAFGVITTLPVIVAIGILMWADLPGADIRKQSKFLL